MSDQKVVKDAEVVATTVDNTEKTTQTVSATPASVAPANSKEDTLAIVSAVLSGLNLCSWLMPYCGCPMSIAALITGFMGLKSGKYSTFAIISLIVSGIALIVNIVMLVIVVIAMASGDTSYSY